MHMFINSLDIMECKDGLHNCSQVCIELQGEFSCTCYGGYELLEDRISCKGTVTVNHIMYSCIDANLYYVHILNTYVQYEFMYEQVDVLPSNNQALGCNFNINANSTMRHSIACSCIVTHVSRPNTLLLEQTRIQVLSTGHNIVALQLLNWWLQAMNTAVVSAVMIYVYAAKTIVQ